LRSRSYVEIARAAPRATSIQLVTFGRKVGYSLNWPRNSFTSFTRSVAPRKTPFTSLPHPYSACEKTWVNMTKKRNCV